MFSHNYQVSLLLDIIATSPSTAAEQAGEWVRKQAPNASLCFSVLSKDGTLTRVVVEPSSSAPSAPSLTKEQRQTLAYVLDLALVQCMAASSLPAGASFRQSQADRLLSLAHLTEDGSTIHEITQWRDQCTKAAQPLDEAEKLARALYPISVPHHSDPQVKKDGWKACVDRVREAMRETGMIKEA